MVTIIIIPDKILNPYVGSSIISNYIDKGAGNYSPRPSHSFLLMKFYWCTATLVCLCVIYHCFFSRVAEIEYLQHEPYGPQSLKYLLSDSLQESLLNLDTDFFN